MTSARRIATPALLGAWGALLAWGVMKAGFADRIGSSFARLQPGDTSVGLPAIKVGILGALIGLGQVLASIRNSSRTLTYLTPTWLLWGLAVGVGPALVSNLVDRLHPPPWLLWASVGALAGSMDGLLSGSRRSTLSGLVGGSLGGLIGWLLVPEGVLQPGSPQHALPAVRWALAGGIVGAWAALARLATCPAWITISSGPRNGQVVPIDRAIFAIGLDPRNDLSLPAFGGRTLGLYHARIRRKSGAFRIENTCPSPTLVDGHQVRGPRPLNHGARINVAGHKLRFRIHPWYRSKSVPDQRVTVTFPVPNPSPIAVPATSPGASRSPVRASASRPTRVASSRDRPERVQHVQATRGPAPRDVVDDDPDDDLLNQPSSPFEVNAPSAAEAAKECIAPCPTCRRRYFGAPNDRYCDVCRAWF